MKYLNALNIIDGVGSQKMSLLLEFFGSAENAWKASPEELRQSRIGEVLAEKIIQERKKIDPDAEWEKLQKENIQVIALSDPAYPGLLRQIHNPPSLLYIKGVCNNFNISPMIAIVGSRKFTAYGNQAAFAIARDLARAGITVVSGLALGIDAIAHRGALEGKGQTLAILGSSLEDFQIGPRINFGLSREIIESGALLSEYPLGTPATPGTFPARNRLMAGMTLGTLVIEAARGSGSLITANLALEFDREIFAVPGSIFSPQSEGANDLIKSGAKLVGNAKDILEELKIEEAKNIETVKKIIPASAEEEIILKQLSHEPVHIDKIIKMVKLEVNVISSVLSIMEMKGLAKDIGGQNYVKI